VSDSSTDTQPDSPHSFTLEVCNKMGVHARPAAMIVRIATRFNGDIWVTKEDGDRVNAKSIMGIMMLAAAKGSKLTFECNADQGTELESEMTELFSSKFQDE
jgi:phosphocarrier protein HPr